MPATTPARSTWIRTPPDRPIETAHLPIPGECAVRDEGGPRRPRRPPTSLPDQLADDAVQSGRLPHEAPPLVQEHLDDPSPVGHREVEEVGDVGGLHLETHGAEAE